MFENLPGFLFSLRSRKKWQREKRRCVRSWDVCRTMAFHSLTFHFMLYWSGLSVTFFFSTRQPVEEVPLGPSPGLGAPYFKFAGTMCAPSLSECAVSGSWRRRVQGLEHGVPPPPRRCRTLRCCCETSVLFPHTLPCITTHRAAGRSGPNVLWTSSEPVGIKQRPVNLKPDLILVWTSLECLHGLQLSRNWKHTTLQNTAVLGFLRRHVFEKKKKNHIYNHKLKSPQSF